MGTQIFVQISTGQHQQKTFPGRSRGLTFGTEEQRGAKRFKLTRLFLGSRRTARPHARRLIGTTGKGGHRHRVMLAKPF